MSLSTLDRRIASGEVRAKREPRGKRHRVYVMLDDKLPGAVETPQSDLVAAQERIQSLEAQVELLQGQLEQERKHNAGPVDELNSPQGLCSSWWRFWQIGGEERMLVGGGAYSSGARN